MPLSPSMKVMALRHDAVFMNAGSYVIMPKSSSLTLIFRRSRARIVSSLMGTSYDLPVRLSVMVRVSAHERHLRGQGGCRTGAASAAMRRRNLLQIPEAGSDDGHRGDGRRFSAQSPRSEPLKETARGPAQRAARPPSSRLRVR